MGSGKWNPNNFRSYSMSKGLTMDDRGDIANNLSTQEMFTSRRLDADLNPLNVMRECVDTSEHPNTIPVIIALDVTGSMGRAAVEVAKKINSIITDLYDKYKDIEFMVIGIGDLSYDSAPIQISQFESDIRIAEQLDKIYFEGGGGGNGFESYTAAWYMGLKHTKLDCWNRGKKGIIITTGDEPLNPYLPMRRLSDITGDNLEADVETKELYELASEKFDIYHIAVDDRSTSYSTYASRIENTFGQIILCGRYKVSNMDSLASTIVKCIDDSIGSNESESFIEKPNKTNENSNNSSDGISW